MEKAELYKYFIEENHSREDTAKHFGVTNGAIKAALRKYGIKKSKSDSLKSRYEIKVDRDEIYKYYIEENHTREECLEHFNVSLSVFKRWLTTYGIKKDMKARQQNIEKHFNASSPFMVNEIKDKVRSTLIEKYGVDNIFSTEEFKEKAAKTKLDKYRSETYNNREKAKETNLSRYGVDNIFKDTERMKQSYIDSFGADNPMRNKEIAMKSSSKHNYDGICKKASETYRNKTGYSNPFSDPEIHKGIMIKASEKCKQDYGYEYYCMRPEARIAKGISGPNARFAKLLDDNGISYSTEFPIGSFQYDFKVDNYLIEIDPYPTHNSTWNPFNKPLEKDYHLRKSNVAKENGYHCIHIWDWDNVDAIINLLKRKEESIGARKCIVKEVSIKEAKLFLNKYHIQGYAKDDIRLGLYYNSELVSIMTFGKPRYNKNFEYELVRYCSSINVTGGSSKLFKHFLNMCNPKSICSYCDLSKFKGETYSLLGFKLRSISSPAIHWYDGHRHITDNLLRQWGFDNLFNASYGKGTSNRDLMLSHGFVEVYDCGQATYEYYSKQRL